jgi:2-oxoisovalerate dehydrogenase E1 component alpha subunit
MDNPISRFEKYCVAKGWWSETQTEELKKDYRKQIVKALEVAEKKKRPSISSIFQDTYKDIPDNLKVRDGSISSKGMKVGTDTSFAGTKSRIGKTA